MSLGFKSKDLCKSQGKVHNCYKDLKNCWINSAENERIEMIFSVFSIFLTGFLLAQVSVFFVKNQKNEDFLSHFEDELWVDTYIDYALGLNGAKIIDEYSQSEYMGWFSVLSNNKRNAVLSQNNEPGNCWAFDGSYGYIGIHLAARILPRNFTIYHINALQYSTAPKKFNVYSLDNRDECVLLGKYEFEFKIKGVKRKNWGMFQCLYQCDEYVERVVLEVVDNYGATGTCVYQFRVHGVID